MDKANGVEGTVIIKSESCASMFNGSLEGRHASGKLAAVGMVEDPRPLVTHGISKPPKVVRGSFLFSIYSNYQLSTV